MSSHGGLPQPPGQPLEQGTVAGQGIDDELAPGIAFGDGPVLGDLEQDRDSPVPAVRMDPVVVGIRERRPHP